MRIALAQLNFTIGDFSGNEEKIIRAIEKAKKENTDLVVFSELAVCGYPPLDLLEHKWFIEKCESTVKSIAAKTDGIAIILGAPAINTNETGKLLYNSGYFIENEKIKQIVHKSLLPTYDIFDEYRYFESNTEFACIDFKGEKIALTICEDLWFDQPAIRRFSKNQIYTINPIEQLVKEKPSFIVNIAASPFSYTNQEVKQQILENCASKYNLPVLYCNQIGAHTELIFDGGSMVFNSDGALVSQLSAFDEDLSIVNTNELSKKETIASYYTKENYIEYIHNGLVLGLGDYFAKMGFKKATLGLSGGIDSAVTLALAAEALGAENIRVLLMPSKYSSEHSLTDAIELANTLGVQYSIVSIEQMVDAYEQALSPVFEGMEVDITEENIQARIRGTLLMAISNKFGNILLNTSNKSEAAVGYSTLYGDMNGGLSVLGDVYKDDVYKLARYINRNGEIIPENTIVKPPSAELRPDQKDTDSLPEYEILDGILYRYIELQYSASDIIQDGYNETLVKRVIRMVNNNEYKRFQTPPILRVSSKAFGLGRKMPLVAKYLVD
jgi:NAD+ synthase (glutamine-hydrolysing)